MYVTVSRYASRKRIHVSKKEICLQREYMFAGTRYVTGGIYVGRKEIC